MLTRRRESGAVSLFLVIFAMLLITVITVSFLRLMVKDQAASSVSDLSQSAYDSAMAGTEDAKRELIFYRTKCGGAANASFDCSTLRNTINSNVCNVGLKDVVALDDPAKPKEVLVQQTSSMTNDSQLNQAYTCVKMQLDTSDYVGTLPANTSKVIPLTTAGSASAVTVEWFSPDDITSTTKTVSLAASGTSLLGQSNWPVNRPSLLRTQLIQYGSTFKVSDFDNSTTANSNTNTLFLYPISGPTASSIDFTNDVRRTPNSTEEKSGIPQQVKCSTNISGGGYACKATLNLPAPIGSGSARTAYLRLSSFYNATHFRISFADGSQFSGVQPIIDSTGRANDQYRRVEMRVDLVNTDFAFPEATVDITGSFCKNFMVTSDTANYIPGTCTP